MKERTNRIACQFGILERLKQLETQLLEDVLYVESLDFDLDDWLNDMYNVIILVKYNIPGSLPNYFDVRRKTLKKILEIAKSFGLNPSDDRIKDHGEHWYIIRNCDGSWMKK